MPEHIHLLITEPEIGTPSKVMQVLKQRTARALLPKRNQRNPRQRNLFAEETAHRAFWQARFYDLNVWTTKKRVEKLGYMHRNPVKRGLVESPEQWRWSSYRFYRLDEAGPVRVNAGWTEISFRDRVASRAVAAKNHLLQASGMPALAKNARTGHPLEMALPARPRAWATRHRIRIE
jgi:REP element-mobilizing transposase RayT